MLNINTDASISTANTVVSRAAEIIILSYPNREDKCKKLQMYNKQNKCSCELAP